MNLQLHHVVADITGSTGLRIIRCRSLPASATLRSLACLRHYSCHSEVLRRDREGIFTGSYRTEQTPFALEQALALYDAYHEKASSPATSGSKPC